MGLLFGGCVMNSLINMASLCFLAVLGSGFAGVLGLEILDPICRSVFGVSFLSASPIVFAGAFFLIRLFEYFKNPRRETINLVGFAFVVLIIVIGFVEISKGYHCRTVDSLNVPDYIKAVIEKGI